MSDFSLFMKQNKAKREEVQYAATKSLCDAKGKPLLWTLRPITTQEFQDMRDRCTIEVPVTGKPGMTRERTNGNKLNAMLLAACITYPDLHDAELQDSYGVKSAEDLVLKMIDNAGEYGLLVAKVNELCGFDITLEDQVEEAKKS